MQQRQPQLADRTRAAAREQDSGPEAWKTGATIVDLAELRSLATQWDQLAKVSVEPNPYFSRRVIEAHVAGGVLDVRSLRFVVLRNGPDLVGLLPFQARAGRCGWKRSDSACASPFMMLSTPLIARLPGGEAAVTDWADSLLDAIGDHARGEPFSLPRLSLSCAIGSEILKAVARRNWPFRVFDPFERPVADLAETYENYARAFIGRNRRRSIRRLRNRLAGAGVLRHEVATHGLALAAAADAFLALEAGGWKGRERTALACRPETARMLLAMIEDDVADAPPSGASRGAGMRADLLLLDERPIAASVGFVSDGVAYMWKIADDETMRRHGPGVVLEDAILRQAHLDDGIRRLDSAAGPGSVLETLYAGRTPIGDLVFVPSAQGGHHTLLTAEDIRRRLKGALKSLRNALRPRSRPGAPAPAIRRLPPVAHR